MLCLDEAAELGNRDHQVVKPHTHILPFINDISPRPVLWYLLRPVKISSVRPWLGSGCAASQKFHNGTSYSPAMRTMAALIAPLPSRLSAFLAMMGSAPQPPEHRRHAPCAETWVTAQAPCLPPHSATIPPCVERPKAAPA